MMLDIAALDALDRNNSAAILSLDRTSNSCCFPGPATEAGPGTKDLELALSSATSTKRIKAPLPSKHRPTETSSDGGVFRFGTGSGF